MTNPKKIDSGEVAGSSLVLCSLTLAERIARRILTYNKKGAIGYRIAIKSGTWTEDHSQEVDQGGLCHAALINVIQEEINSANGVGVSRPDKK